MSALEFACECCGQLAYRTPRDTGVDDAERRPPPRAAAASQGAAFAAANGRSRREWPEDLRVREWPR